MTITQCPVCLADGRPAGVASYYNSAQRFNTSMSYCSTCNTYYRSVTLGQITDHIPATSYVQPGLEAKWYRDRNGFFEYIIATVNRHLPPGERPRSVCDFGCSYGHLLDVALRDGFTAVGVEADSRLVQLTTARGLAVVERVSQLPGGIDAVTIIDALYYLPDPLKVMAELLTKVRPDGILVIRVTNRNWLGRLKGCWKAEPDLSLLGDVIISYSLKSLRILLRRAGLTIVDIVPDKGVGKKVPQMKRFAYRILAAVSALSANRIVLAPGIIVVAKREASGGPNAMAQHRTATTT